MASNPQAPLESDDAIEYGRRLAAVRSLMEDHGFDALVLSDYDSGSRPPYAWFMSGFYISPSGGPRSAVVVIPLAGDPTLVVPAGIRGSFSHLAHTHSWIANIASTYRHEPDWEARTRWGFLADAGDDVADVLEAAGLARARIGIAGTWIGFEQTKARLPHVRFLPTVRTAPQEDLLSPLLDGNSTWEIKRLEVAHAAADAAATSFITSARAGEPVEQARKDAVIAGLREGADEIGLLGSVSLDPWTFWDWKYARASDRFEGGRLYTIEPVAVVDGYSVESARSFVIGSASAAQTRITSAITQSVREVLEALAAGVTGDELWRQGLGPLTSAGLDPCIELGHHKGFRGSDEGRIRLLPGNHEALSNTQAVVVHACAIDKATGQAAMAGDTIVIGGDSRWRNLSASPLVTSPDTS